MIYLKYYILDQTSFKSEINVDLQPYHLINIVNFDRIFSVIKNLVFS